MGKSLGITAFVLLMISFPLPIIGNYLSILALLIAAGAALAGERTWALVVPIVGGIKLFFLSPSWMYMMFSAELVRGVGPMGDAVARQQSGINSSYFFFTLFVIALPIAIMVWQRFKNPDAPQEPSDQ